MPGAQKDPPTWWGHGGGLRGLWSEWRDCTGQGLHTQVVRDIMFASSNSAPPNPSPKKEAHHFHHHVYCHYSRVQICSGCYTTGIRDNPEKLLPCWQEGESIPLYIRWPLGKTKGRWKARDQNLSRYNDTQKGTSEWLWLREFDFEKFECLRGHFLRDRTEIELTCGQRRG